MTTNRRAALVALMCSPLFSQARKQAHGPILVELNPETENSPILEVRYRGKTVTFTAAELMAALEPPSFPTPTLSESR
jgi:hypothetical protein